MRHLLIKYRLFPYAKFYRWLSYGEVDKNYFQNREFSFTLKDDVYIRYLSFANEQEMRDGTLYARRSSAIWQYYI
jgi:DNA primase catalytic subunit